MTATHADHLPPEIQLALAWTAPLLRSMLAAAFQLDQRLARIVARTSEPVLGQMRLAWWRDSLGQPVAGRVRGDAVLDALGVHWAGREAALVAMIDGWEVLVTADTLAPEAIPAFGTKRAVFFGALAGDGNSATNARIAAAAFRWSIADAAAGVSDAGERRLLVAAGLAHDNPRGRLPKTLRGLAVLDALSRRALQRGGRPLMEGRGAPLAAMRAAIFLT